MVLENRSQLRGGRPGEKNHAEYAHGRQTDHESPDYTKSPPGYTNGRCLSEEDLRPAADAGCEGSVQLMLEEIDFSADRCSAFRNQEKTFFRPDEFISLADAVMEELDDKRYAAELLGKAEEIMSSRPFFLRQYQTLILAVDQLIGDTEWIQRLLDNCADKIESFAQVQTLGQTAAMAITDREFGGEWARTFYKRWEDRLLAEGAFIEQKINKLARLVKRDLGDQQWALALQENGRERGRRAVPEA